MYQTKILIAMVMTCLAVKSKSQTVQAQKTAPINVLSKSSSNDNRIKWYDWAEIEILQKQNPKPILVWIYADWCSHCNDFKNSTLQDPEIIEKLNSGDFYPVKLNFEDKRTFIFRNKSYKWIAPSEEKMAHNELALALMNNIFGLPSFVYFDKNFNLLQDVKGYKNAKDFEIISNYFIKEKYKTQDWNTYTSEILNPRPNNPSRKEDDFCK